MTDGRRFLESVRRELDESVDALDAATLSRLNRARQRALDAGLQHRGRWQPLAAGVVLASVAVLALSLWLARPAVEPQALDDLELLIAAEPIEFYQELEFYEWLDSEQAG